MRPYWTTQEMDEAVGLLLYWAHLACKSKNWGLNNRCLAVAEHTLNLLETGRRYKIS